MNWLALSIFPTSFAPTAYPARVINRIVRAVSQRPFCGLQSLSLGIALQLLRNGFLTNCPKPPRGRSHIPGSRLHTTWQTRKSAIDPIHGLTHLTDDNQFFGARTPAGAFGSGLSSGGNSSNSAFIAVTALPCSAMSLSGSGVVELMSDTF
jgi:hypothetical protein